MSNIGLFLVGAAVTMLVTFAMGLMVWGALLDGRYAREQRAAEARPHPRPDHRQ
jgi:hypothetical protein